jgi:MFS family permease
LKKFEDLSLEHAEIMEETKHLIRLISKETIENDRESINFDNNCKIEQSQILTETLKKLENQTLSHAGKKRVKSTYKCVEWVYDNSLYGRTTVTDFNLVCLDSHLKALTQNTFILGTGCSVFTGIISDKFGRRSALILMITILVVTLNATQFLMHTAALTRNQKFVIFTISRFFQGVGTTFYSVSFVLLLEITGPKHRVTAGNILAYSFSIGQIILVCVAYVLKDWLKIKWVISLYVLPFLMYYWIVPESPRWLLSMNKIKQAGLVINKINRINNSYEHFVTRLLRLIHLNRLIKQKEADETTENQNVEDVVVEDENSWIQMFSVLQEESSKLSVLRTTTSYKHALEKIFKSRILIKQCLILFYVWMVILAIYLGISGGIVSNLDKMFDPYFVFFIAAIFEFLSIVTVHLVLNRFGRKFPLVIFMLMSSITIYLIP